MFNVIAIDGPAASGKSSTASMVAARLGIPYVNTGNMYRAVTWFTLENGLGVGDIDESTLAPLLEKLDLDYIWSDTANAYVLMVNGEPAGGRIRSPAVAAAVSVVAALPCVRSWLVERQRRLAADGAVMVMEGRDIGTTVFPEARHKFFLTASPEVRARRRLSQKGEIAAGATVETVAAEIAARDRMDMERPIAPLRQAADAQLVDSSDMTIDEVVDAIVAKIEVEG